MVTNRKEKNLCRTGVSDGSCHHCFPEKEAGLRRSVGCQGPSTGLDQLPRQCSRFRTRGWYKPGRTSALRMGVYMGLPGWTLQAKAESRNPVMGPGLKPHAGQASSLTGGWRDLQGQRSQGRAIRIDFLKIFHIVVRVVSGSQRNGAEVQKVPTYHLSLRPPPPASHLVDFGDYPPAGRQLSLEAGFFLLLQSTL